MIEHCGLLDFPEFDPDAEIRSPRSIQAAASEGIHPQELIYMPIERFEDEDVEPLVAQLRHDFYEVRRQDLLAQARDAWELQVVGSHGTSNSLKSLEGVKKLIVDPVCSDRLYNPTTPQHRTLLWFKDRAHDFSPHAQAQELRSSVDPRFKRSPLSPMSASMSKSASLPSSPSGFRGSMSAAPLHPKYPSLGCPVLPTSLVPSKKPHDIIGNPEGLQEMLDHMNSVPGEDTTVEWEMARRSQNNLVALKEIADRKRTERHGNQSRISAMKVMAADKQFKTTLQEHHEKLALRDVREVFSHPERDLQSPRVDEVTQTLRDKNVQRTVKWRVYQNRRVGERLEFDQGFEHKMIHMRESNQMKTAQLSMEARVRWRYQNRNVESRREEQKNDLLQGFVDKQSKRSNQSAADARQAYLRKELYILRESNRKMNDRQKEWKAEYILEKKKADGEARKFADNMARSKMRALMFARATSDSGLGSPSSPGLASLA